jgi:hypothetical protein
MRQESIFAASKSLCQMGYVPITKRVGSPLLAGSADGLGFPILMIPTSGRAFASDRAIAQSY